MPSIFDNGGMIGATLDFGSTDRYILSQAYNRPTYIGGGSASAPSLASNTTFNFPSFANGPLQAGDIVFALFAASDTVDYTFSNSAGWTKVNDIYVNGTNDIQSAIFYKIMGSTPDTNIVIASTGTETGTSPAVIFHAWRGVDQTSPLDVTYTASHTVSATTSLLANPPAITPVTQNALVLVCIAGAHTGGVDTYSHSGLTNVVSLGTDDTTYDISAAIGSYESWTSGSYDPAAFTSTETSTTSHTSTATILAIRPAITYTYGNYKNSGIWSLDAVLDSIIISSGPIQFIGSATGTSSVSLTSLTGGSRSSAQAGDFVLVVGARGPSVNEANDIEVVGYTVIQDIVSNSSSQDNLVMDVAYKYLTAADTSVSITNGASSIAYVFSGVSATNPLDVTSTVNTYGTVSISPPAITPVTSGSWIVSVVGIGSDTNGATFSNTTLSNKVSFGGTRSHVGIATYTSWTSGAYTPTGWSTNDADGTGAGAAVTIALRSA